MKYYFVFDKSQEDIPTLIIYRDEGSVLFGATASVVKVITGEKAIQLIHELTEKAKEDKP